jgi:hypothetical protein
MISEIEARLRFLEQRSDRLARSTNSLADKVGQFAQDVMMTSNGQQNGKGKSINFLIRLFGCNGLPLENQYVAIGIGFQPVTSIPSGINFYESEHPRFVGRTDRSGYVGFKVPYPIWIDRDGYPADISTGASYHFKRNADGFWVIDPSQTSSVVVVPGYYAQILSDKTSVFNDYLSSLTYRIYFSGTLSPLSAVNTPSQFYLSSYPLASSLVYRSRPRALRSLKVSDNNGGATQLDYSGAGWSLRTGTVYSGTATVSGTYAISWRMSRTAGTTQSNIESTTLTATVSTIVRSSVERPVAYGTETGTGLKEYVATSSATNNPIQVKFDFSATGLPAVTGLSYVTLEDVGCQDNFSNYYKYSVSLDEFAYGPGNYVQISDSNIGNNLVNACVSFDPSLTKDTSVGYPSDGSLLHKHSDLAYTQATHTTLYFTVASGYKTNSTQTNIVYWYYFNMDYYNYRPTLTIAAYKFNGYYTGSYAGRDQDIVTESASSYVSTGYGQSYEFLFTGSLASDLGVSGVTITASNFDTTTLNTLPILMDPVSISDNNQSNKASLASMHAVGNSNYGLAGPPELIPERCLFTSTILQDCASYNVEKDRFEIVQGYPVYYYDNFSSSTKNAGGYYGPHLDLFYWMIGNHPQCASLNGNTLPSGTILGRQTASGYNTKIQVGLSSPTYNSTTETDTYAVTGDASTILGITSVSISHGKRSDYSIKQKQFTFTSNSEGWTGYPTYDGTIGTIWDSSHGATNGCLSGFASSTHAADVPFSFVYSGTWQSLGVPAGAQVQSIGLNLKENGRGGVVSSTYGPHVLADSNGNTVGTMRMSEQIQPAFPNTWRQVVCSNTLVPTGMQASNSNIKLILNGVAAGGDTSDTYVSFDDVTYTIFYK